MTTPETTVINLTLNKTENFDYEVIVNSNNTFNIPLKLTLSILKIAFTQNHVTKEVTFLADYRVDLKNQKIYYKNQIFDFSEKKSKLIYLKEGILDSVKEEIFIPIQALDEILEDSITANMNDYSVSILSDRITQNTNTGNQTELKIDKILLTEINLVVPENNPLFSLNAIKFDEAFQCDKTKQIDQNFTKKESLYNNTLQSSIIGGAFGGDIRIRTNLRSYNDKLFSFGGINANYEKEWNNIKLEVGNVSGLNMDEINAGDGVLGVNINNKVSSKRNLFNLPEIFDKNTNLNIFVNQKYIKSLSSEETQKQLVLIKDSHSSDSPVKFAMIAGATGYNDRFFSSYEILNDASAKKLTAGISLLTPLNKKMEFETLGIGDYIISMPKQIDLAYVTDPNNLLTLSISKDFRLRQGYSQIFSLKHKTLKDFIIKANSGISLSNNRGSPNTQNTNTFGYLTELGIDYKNSIFGINSGIFDYSPDFYLAGSSGLIGNTSEVNDKRGIKFGGKFDTRLISLNGNFQRYNSNLDRYLNGGHFKFDDYQYNIKIPVTQRAILTFYRNQRKGHNAIGDIQSAFNRFDSTFRITSNLNLEADATYNAYKTIYSDKTVSSSNFSSKYSSLTQKINYSISPKIGALSLIHEISKTKSENFTRNYNTARIGYVFPSFFNIMTSVTGGYQYKSDDKAFDLSCIIHYMLPSGRSIGFNYQYNYQTGVFLDDLFIPKSSRHSFIVHLTDGYSFSGSSIVPNVFSGQNEGFIQVIAYLDANQNGILDKGEPLIKDIPIKMTGLESKVYTDKKGKYTSKSIIEGFYDVKLDYDDLPTLLSICSKSKKDYLVKVERKKCTKVYFGLISSVGNVSGKLVITDEFGNPLDLKDLVVSVKNEKNEEVDYTVVSQGETYTISSLMPGNYIVSLDEEFMKLYNLKPESEKRIVIPPVYDNYVDIQNLDLKYVQSFEKL